MKYIVLLFPLLVLFGCSPTADTDAFNEPPPDVKVSKKDDSTACAYWRCSKTKELYLQKYVKQADGKYKPAGGYKLNEGIGAFPLEELDQYKGGEQLGTSGG